MSLEWLLGPELSECMLFFFILLASYAPPPQTHEQRARAHAGNGNPLTQPRAARMGCGIPQ